jgi:putative spermidine/putrescine transport system substrate-binding protein
MPVRRARRRPACVQPGRFSAFSPRVSRKGAKSGKPKPVRQVWSYFAEMNKAGNFVPVIGKSGTLAQGSTPIVAAWDYNALSWRETLNGNPPTEVVVPGPAWSPASTFRRISAYAPHPNAAKLWMEYLYSDEGQLGWLKGYCHPARFNAMVKAGKVPQDLLDKLPPAEAYEKAIFPTLEEVDANKAAVTEAWDSVVGANVQ